MEIIGFVLNVLFFGVQKSRHPDCSCRLRKLENKGMLGDKCRSLYAFCLTIFRLYGNFLQKVGFNIVLLLIQFRSRKIMIRIYIAAWSFFQRFFLPFSFALIFDFSRFDNPTSEMSRLEFIRLSLARKEVFLLIGNWQP